MGCGGQGGPEQPAPPKLAVGLCHCKRVIRSSCTKRRNMRPCLDSASQGSIGVPTASSLMSLRGSLRRMGGEMEGGRRATAPAPADWAGLISAGRGRCAGEAALAAGPGRLKLIRAGRVRAPTWRRRRRRGTGQKSTVARFRRARSVLESDCSPGGRGRVIVASSHHCAFG